MHEVVSNTTPIISLLKIDKLDLLRQLYDYIAYSKSPATRRGITPSFSGKEAMSAVRDCPDSTVPYHTLPDLPVILLDSNNLFS
jgi:hypothetical protein